MDDGSTCVRRICSNREGLVGAGVIRQSLITKCNQSNSHFDGTVARSGGPLVGTRCPTHLKRQPAERYLLRSRILRVAVAVFVLTDKWVVLDKTLHAEGPTSSDGGRTYSEPGRHGGPGDRSCHSGSWTFGNRKARRRRWLGRSPVVRRWRCGLKWTTPSSASRGGGAIELDEVRQPQPPTH